MKNKLMALFLAVLFAATNSWGDTAGDYRSSVVLGNWSSAGSWQTYNGSTWVAASLAPDGLSATITIQGSHKLVVDAPISIGACTIIVNGYLKDSMVITYPSPYTSTVIVNGTFEFAHASASNQGLPTATWNTGSNCIISGITSATTGVNANQNFYNFEVNCPSWSGNLNFGWGGTSTSVPTTINGNVLVKSTGASGRWNWCAPVAGTIGSPSIATVTVLGNLIVDGSATTSSSKISVTGSGSGNNYVLNTISIMGNITVTGNPIDSSYTNFSITRSGQGGTGITVWNVGGDFSMSDAITQNGNTTLGKFVFNKSGLQNLYFNKVTYASSGINFDVVTGSTLQLNSNLNIVGTLNLAGGIINSSSSNLLIMGGNYTPASFISGTLLGGSSSSYVNGPMGYINNIITSKTCLFTIGKNGKYHPFTLVVTQDAATQTTYTAELFNSTPAANTLPGSLDKVSSVRYFAVNKGAGANIITASATLNYNNDDGVTDYNNLRIAKSDGSGNWVNIGGVGTANGVGSITSTVNFISLSNLVLANATGGNNPLKSPKVLLLTAIIEGFYDGSVMVSDTVTIELHNSTTPWGLVDQAEVLLSTSGFGTANFFSVVDATNYYIAIKHISGLETWSKNAQQFSDGTLNFNLTTAQTQAYGDNLKYKVNKWCIINGDCNQDQYIDGSDYLPIVNNWEAGEPRMSGDTNGDQFIDGSDYLQIVNNFEVGAVTPLTMKNISSQVKKQIEQKNIKKIGQ